MGSTGWAAWLILNRLVHSPVVTSMNGNIIRDEKVFEATLNAVIINDNSDLASQVKATLERAAQRADASMHCHVRPWLVDLLNCLPTSETALVEATDAHMIVLALRRLKSVPACLRIWLESWIRRRAVPEAALAIWEGPNADPDSAGITAEAVKIANCYGLDLIISDGGPPAVTGSV
jgi:hypothetical protein